MGDITDGEYVEICIKYKAAKVARTCARGCDIEDYEQEMRIAIERTKSKFNSKKATYRTFVSIILTNVAKDLIRKHFSHKNRIINDSVNLESLQNE